MKAIRMVHQAWALAALSGLAGVPLSCTADFPAGVIACDGPSDCPKGQSCRIEPDAGEGLCFPGTGSEASGATLQPSAEAGAPDASSPDGSHYDDPQPDAGGAGAAGRAGGAGAAGRAGASGKPQAGAGGRSGTAGATAGRPASAGTTSPGTPAAGSGGQAGRSSPAPCDNPARECDAGAIDTGRETCGTCNKGDRTRTRQCDESTCTWGAWSEWTDCSGGGVCSPGETAPGATAACGACGTGTQMTVKTCTDACEWGPAVAMGSCADPAECAPNATGSRTVNCPGCGSKTQKRTCSATTCSFGAWVDSSACSWCDACGELVYCDTPDSVAANRGTWCRPHNGCSNDQATGRCKELLASAGCTLHQPYYVGN